LHNERNGHYSDLNDVLDREITQINKGWILYEVLADL